MRICVAVARETIADALAVARRMTSAADVIEIRLDYLQAIDVDPFPAAIKTPLLFTNRAVWEGGRFQGDEDARIDPLVRAVELKAFAVDLEVMASGRSCNRLLAEIDHGATRLILSWHNFAQTPGRAELVDRLAMMRDKGADIGKIVTMAHDYRDVLRVLGLQEDAASFGLPLIAFCMGTPGVISRLATLELGGYMTYCAADGEEGTAPGQLSVGALRDMLERLHR